MGQFVQAYQPNTPCRLFHYTKPTNIMSMLDAKCKSVCFWLKNNKDKNDENELKYGRELMERVRDYLNSIDQPSLLNQISGFDNSYSASFTEGVLDDHMLKEYGTARLEFDFRKYNERIYKCEYYTEDDLAELYKVMIGDLQSMEDINRNSRDDLKFLKICNLISLEYDLLTKISSIKLKDEWECEGEWRFVLHKQVDDKRYFRDAEGFERLLMHIPITYLTGITLFYDDNTKQKTIDLEKNIMHYINKNNLGQFDVKLKKITDYGDSNF